MMKQFLIILMSLASFQMFACTNALPTDDSNFCSSFKSAATCYCIAAGQPSRQCEDLDVLYGRMIYVYKTLEKACNHQTQTSVQNCIDNWNCYRNGGIDSEGRSCSGTTLSCR